MVDLSEYVIDEAAHEGTSLTGDRFLVLVEQYHPTDEPGIERDVLTAYAEAIAERPDVRLDVASLLDEVDRRLTDDEEWVGTEAFYELEAGRVSRFPAGWHDALGGPVDVAAYLRFFETEVPEFKDDIGRGGAGPGLPEDALLEVITVVGKVDQEAARRQLEAARDAGVVVEDADQHPQSGVYLREEAEEARDESLDR